VIPLHAMWLWVLGGLGAWPLLAAAVAPLQRFLAIGVPLASRTGPQHACPPNLGPAGVPYRNRGRVRGSCRLWLALSPPVQTFPTVSTICPLGLPVLGLGAGQGHSAGSPNISEGEAASSFSAIFGGSLQAGEHAMVNAGLGPGV
jgi:hypothetical protein